MSKKRRLNHRPKKGPSRKVQQRQAPKNPEEEAVVNHTRRRIMFGATTTAILGLLGYKMFERDEPAVQPIKERGFKKPEIKSKIPEYDEWSSGIELPEIEFDERPLSWDDHQKKAHFLSNEIDDEKLSKFHRQFRDLKESVINELSGVESEKDRTKLLLDFFNKLVNNYIGVSQKMIEHPESADDLQKIINDLNRLLVLDGYFIRHKIGSGQLKFAIYKIDEMKEIGIRSGEDKINVPIILVKKDADLLDNPISDTIETAGMYISNGRYIVIDEENTISQFREALESFKEIHPDLAPLIKNKDIKELMRTALRLCLMHEVMHAAYDQINGMGPGYDLNSVKNKGTVMMDGYAVLPRDYLRKTNIKMHEMTATGYGLLHSGEMAQIIYILAMAQLEIENDQDKYSFATEIMGREAKFNLNIGDVKTEKDIYRGILNTPIEKLHNVGRRMAEFGIHLAEKGSPK